MKKVHWISILIGLTASLLTIGLTQLKFMNALEHKVYDFRFYSRALSQPQNQFYHENRFTSPKVKTKAVETVEYDEQGNPVDTEQPEATIDRYNKQMAVVVKIDSESLSEIGKWPWPRDVHARFLQSIQKCGNIEGGVPRGVLFDIGFILPSSMPQSIAEDTMYSDPQLYNKLQSLYVGMDSTLTKEMERHGNVFIDFFLLDTQAKIESKSVYRQKQKMMDILNNQFISASGNTITHAKVFPDFETLYLPYVEAARGAGGINVWPDEDEVVRKFPLVYYTENEWGEHFYPGNVLLMILDYYGVPIEEMGDYVDVKLGEYLKIKKTKILKRDVFIPIDNQGRLTVNYAGEETIYYIQQKITNEQGVVIQHAGTNTAHAVQSVSYRDVVYDDERKMNATIQRSSEIDQKIQQLEQQILRQKIQDGNEEVLELAQQQQQLAQKLNELQMAAMEAQDDPDADLEGLQTQQFDVMTALSEVEGKLKSHASSDEVAILEKKVNELWDKYTKAGTRHQKALKAIAGKYLFVGAFSLGMAKDTHLSPYGTMFGISHMANTFNTMYTRQFIREPGRLEIILFIVAIGIILSFISAIADIRLGAALTFLFLLGITLTSFWLFYEHNYALTTVPLITAVLLTFVSITVFRVILEQLEKQQIRGNFSKYVSAEVVDELMKNPDAVQLGGEKRDVSVFFSDVASFSTISEKLGDPQKLVILLNEYLGAMTEIIIEEKGTLDKYIGDAIMAFWNAPIYREDHPMLCVRSALRQLKFLWWVIQPKLIIEKREGPAVVNIRCGINTGDGSVGNTGCKRRMDYTLLGDSVNLAARLESGGKSYGINCQCSEYTYDRVKDQVYGRYLDMIVVKGKTKPVKTYELYAIKGEEEDTFYFKKDEQLEWEKLALAAIDAGEPVPAPPDFVQKNVIEGMKQLELEWHMPDGEVPPFGQLPSKTK